MQTGSLSLVNSTDATAMYTALEYNRTYLIGFGSEAKRLTYMTRDWPEDHPPMFVFKDQGTGERVSFMLEQLTELERQGAIEYIGVTL